ncbi:DUF5050 domain-containing protein [Alkalibacterium sp. AK22]|uniref:DUF5050 domain-containing protein n=1 Tax=Alkalibacterium sp. AK22 TaxID=1229520 RepID=UPI000551E357|nr:DUF5050 domain-containing protein [Alkalibacterium sp. AK22]
MKIVNNKVNIVMRTLLFLYLPLVLLVGLVVIGFLGMEIQYGWGLLVLYGIVLSSWTSSRFEHHIAHIQLTEAKPIQTVVDSAAYHITETLSTGYRVKSARNWLFGWVSEGEVTLTEEENWIRIEGPSLFVVDLRKILLDEQEERKYKAAAYVQHALTALLLLAPLVFVGGLYREGQVWLHNVKAEGSGHAGESGQESGSHTVQNSGYAVTDGQTLFLLDRPLDIVGVDLETGQRDLIIRLEENTGFLTGLSLFDEWLYFSSEQGVSRVRTDGSGLEEVHSLGWSEELQIMDNGLYFVNAGDDYRVYRMDLASLKLERFPEVRGRELTVYADGMLISQGEFENGNIQRLDPDGRNRQIIAEGGFHAQYHEGDYYYIGDSYQLYRRDVQLEEAEAEQLTEQPVSTFLATEFGLLYHVREEGFPNENGVYTADLDGTRSTLVEESSTGGVFIRVEDSAIFHTQERPNIGGGLIDLEEIRVIREGNS